jgi:hypothetical protein
MSICFCAILLLRRIVRLPLPRGPKMDLASLNLLRLVQDALMVLGQKGQGVRALLPRLTPKKKQGMYNGGEPEERGLQMELEAQRA